MDIAEIRKTVESICRQAKEASYAVMSLPTGVKNDVLTRLAEMLGQNRDAIIAANARDLETGRQKGLSQAMLDRLMLDVKRVTAMANAVLEVRDLKDPVGRLLSETRRPNGLLVSRVSVAIGVIAIIYESRPNVTIDAFSLAFKAGNTVILRGGSESFNSNTVLVDLIRRAIAAAGLGREAVFHIPVTDREAVIELVRQSDFLDLVIPRGGEGLIRSVTENSRVPVIKHYKGVCHVYVDASADPAMAESILVNAKVQRPGVCNSAETLLVHKDFPEKKRLLEALRRSKVEIRADEKLRVLDPSCKAATEEDWSTEYNDLIINAAEVASLDDAIGHINRYGSHHSDTIVTRSDADGRTFLDRVDSAAVYLNASTRFTDGGEFGMGAEIGISTDKIHCRGPMGLEELTSYKFVVRGDGQIRP